MRNDIPFTRETVRDLAWAIGSPPMWCEKDADIRWPGPRWYSDIAEKFQPTLLACDQDPSLLADKLKNQKDRRLGHYHECLWQYWLEHNDRYRLLHANLPIRDHQRTIGEFDLLVEDTYTGKTMHWELAVKFYLNAGDSTQATNWVGPGQRDRLDIKIKHMHSHQSRLRHEPAADLVLRQLGIEVDETWLLLKGRLFYRFGGPASAPPQACPEHLRGFWISASRFSEAFVGRQLLALKRSQWLAPLEGVNMSHTVDSKTLLDRIADQLKAFPQCLAVIQNGVEITRGFVVADDWQKRPAHSSVHR
jgi:hypothetical protein